MRLPGRLARRLGLKGSSDPGHELVSLERGSGNVAVGISGFGSAQVPTDRWRSLGILGHSVYTLRYDSQELPFEPPRTVGDYLVTATRLQVPELRRRWELARRSGDIAARQLAERVAAWTSEGREVLLAGFSLGAGVAWGAARESLRYPHCRPELVGVLLVSGALPNRPEVLDGCGRFGFVVSAFSRSDAALRYLYPRTVDSVETPALGVGRPRHDGVFGVDVTDLVGRDHLWASNNLSYLLRVAVGCGLGAREASPSSSSRRLEDPPRGEVEELWSLLGYDPAFDALLELAWHGDAASCSVVVDLHAWAMGHKRELVHLREDYDRLVAAGGRKVLEGRAPRHPQLDRGLLEIRGLLRCLALSELPQLRSWMSGLPSRGSKNSGASSPAPV